MPFNSTASQPGPLPPDKLFGEKFSKQPNSVIQCYFTKLNSNLFPSAFEQDQISINSIDLSKIKIMISFYSLVPNCKI